MRDERASKPSGDAAESGEAQASRRQVGRIARRNAFVGVAVLLMVVIALMAEAATSVLSPWIWVALMPVFAVACAWTADTRWETGGTLVIRQAAHWGGFGIAYLLLYYLSELGPASGEAPQGSPVIIPLTLAAFYAGLRFGWTFLIVSLGMIAVLAASKLIDQYLLVVGLILAIGVILTLILWRVWKLPAEQPKRFEKPRRELSADSGAAQPASASTPESSGA
ncbi:MAG: hypothetical protein AAGI30_01240 [Planctomycetota bacterium]